MRQVTLTSYHPDLHNTEFCYAVFKKLLAVGICLFIYFAREMNRTVHCSRSEIAIRSKNNGKRTGIREIEMWRSNGIKGQNANKTPTINNW